LMSIAKSGAAFCLKSYLNHKVDWILNQTGRRDKLVIPQVRNVEAWILTWKQL